MLVTLYTVMVLLCADTKERQALRAAFDAGCQQYEQGMASSAEEHPAGHQEQALIRLVSSVLVSRVTCMVL